MFLLVLGPRRNKFHDVLQNNKDELIKRLVNDIDEMFAGLRAREVLTKETVVAFTQRKANPSYHMSKMIDDVADKGEVGYKIFLEVLQFLDKPYVYDKLQESLESGIVISDLTVDKGKFSISFL